MASVAKIADMAARKLFGKSWQEIKDEIHARLPPNRTDEEWRAALRDALKALMNEASMLDAIASEMQKKERHDRTFVAPGEGGQIDWVKMQPEYLRQTGFPLPNGEFVRSDKVQPEHYFYLHEKKMQKWIESGEAMKRFNDLRRIFTDPRGVAAALADEGVPGWGDKE